MVNKLSLKETHTKEINEEDNDETMGTSYNKDKYKDDGTTPYSETSTPYPPNTVQVIDSNDEMKEIEKPLED